MSVSVGSGMDVSKWSAMTQSMLSKMPGGGRPLSLPILLARNRARAQVSIRWDTTLVHEQKKRKGFYIG